MKKLKVLVIDDDSKIINIVTEEGKKLGLDIVAFEPVSTERNALLGQFAIFCKGNQFDYALLDYELWHNFKGYSLIEILKDSKIKFIAFSSSGDKNYELIQFGATDAILKDYNSRGFDRDLLIKGLIKLLK